ncbi:VWA domain-containing protein [Methanoculleus chikugoensis]|uniref:VWA domain-containing protein n=1 Tax=Methanoculleus chikugoensis TaxID=118126 RepID=UPI001FB4723F|nr:VWA domain-containing protein [Methanoculleus chikugoensis]
MESAKGAVLSLLEDAYKNRDRIGLVAFRGDDADVLLPPLSRSVELAYQRLSDIPTGGRTPPLALGLEKGGLQMLERERKKRRDILPMMMLISDGRANAGMGGEIRQEIRSVSGGAIAEAGIRTVIIDTEAVSSRQPPLSRYCREIAGISGGSYYPIAELSAGTVEEIARREGGLFIGS